jgi:2-polyprenyl-3-methyl-5-hydroxy-6-metoxy-1,4-benzoquinol methylase
MFTGNSDKAWERYGKTSPYYSVIVSEEYDRKNLSESALEDFFRNGEKVVSTNLGLVREHLDANFQPTRALDFGCGVGRLTVPLAKICSHVVGVDVSDSMLDEARKNCLERNVLPKVDLLKSDDTLTKVTGTFDFVISLFVLQYIPSRRGKVMMRAIIDRLDAGGVGVLHFTFARKASMIKLRHMVQWTRKYVPFAHNFANLVQRKPFFTPFMQWNNYNLNDVFLVLQETGCRHSYFGLLDQDGNLSIVLFFQKESITRNRLPSFVL